MNSTLAYPKQGTSSIVHLRQRLKKVVLQVHWQKISEEIEYLIKRHLHETLLNSPHGLEIKQTKKL